MNLNLESQNTIPKSNQRSKKYKSKKLKTLKIGSLSYERDWTFAGDVSKQ